MALAKVSVIFGLFSGHSHLYTYLEKKIGIRNNLFVWSGHMGMLGDGCVYYIYMFAFFRRLHLDSCNITHGTLRNYPISEPNPENYMHHLLTSSPGKALTEIAGGSVLRQPTAPFVLLNTLVHTVRGQV